MSDDQDPCLQIAVSQRNECNFLGTEVRRIYFTWGPGYHPHEEKLGKAITRVGLTINLGISHLWLGWSTGPGAQQWLRTHSTAHCPTDPTIGEEAFSEDREDIDFGQHLTALPRKCGGRIAL